MDGSGKVVPSQLLSMDVETNRALLLVQVSVPSLGYKTYYVRAAAKATAGSSGLVRGSADTLENERVRVRVDTKTGCITSLFDKRSNSEALAPPETNTGGQKDSICGNPAASVSRQAKRF